MTAEEQWAAVDRYITDMLVPPDPVLDAALAASDAAGLPPIQVAPNQGKLLALLTPPSRTAADGFDSELSRCGRAGPTRRA